MDMDADLKGSNRHSCVSLCVILNVSPDVILCVGPFRSIFFFQLNWFLEVMKGAKELLYSVCLVFLILFWL